MLLTIVAVILILFLLGSVPAYPYSRGWGWGPSGLITTLLVILVIFWLFGHPW